MKKEMLEEQRKLQERYKTLEKKLIDSSEDDDTIVDSDYEPDVSIKTFSTILSVKERCCIMR